MGGKSSSSAPAPDPNIGAAQRELSALATEQWNYFKNTLYPDIKASIDRQETRDADQWGVMKDIQTKQLEQSTKAYERYEQGAIPAMEKLKADADQYDEAGYREQLAGQARSDVATSFQNQREQESMRQRMYGVDPTSGVAQSNSQALGVQEALMSAAAANQVRTAAKEIGLQKQANVYNMYAGLPAQANANTQLGIGAGQAGFGMGQATVGNATSGAASYNQAAGTAMQGWNSVGQLGVQKYQADVNAYRSQQEANAGMFGGFGKLAGIALETGLSKGGWMLAGSDVRIKDKISKIGELPNGITLYSFEYKPAYQADWGYGPQVGVLAQDVEKIMPDAVHLHPAGYKLVDYAKVMA